MVFCLYVKELNILPILWILASELPVDQPDDVHILNEDIVLRQVAMCKYYAVIGS